MGTNSKLHVQFTSRHWDALGINGETLRRHRLPEHLGGDARRRPGTAGILVDYTGGNIGASFGSGTPTRTREQFLAQIEPVLPGHLRRTGTAGRRSTTGPGYPWTKGSYSYWKVGQYTKFAGAERKRKGNCHFAGEHTSIDFQGYLNGAVESGRTRGGRDPRRR